MRRLSTPRVAVGVLLVGLGGCASATDRPSSAASDQRPAGPVRVVAIENVWGDVVRQLGGGHVRVTSIISNPDADPHTYETDPHDAAAIASAGLVISNGAGYDDFAGRLLRASPSDTRRQLDLTQAEHVTGDDINPHLWYDPIFVTAAARLIASALTSADPVHARDFAANEAAFESAYQPYVTELAAIRARYDGAPVAYTERVPGYLMSGAGLRLATPATFAEAVENGDDPSPGDTAVLEDALRHRKVRLLFVNSQVRDPQTDAVRNLAVQAGVPVVGVSETLPPGEDFQTWQLAQARAVAAGLGG